MAVVTRRDFLAASTGAVAASFLGGNFALAADEDGLLGHGSHRYRVVEGWGVLDSETYPVNDCHGMEMDKEGRIFLLTNNTKNNVIIYNKAGELLDTWGTEYPGAHGLELIEEDGVEYLFITDHNLHQVFKTTLDGKVVLTMDFPESTGFYPNADVYKPTDVAWMENGEFFVCDGYGKSYVMKRDQGGNVLKAIGGPPTMATPHGACIDKRNAEPELVVAVRGKKELHRFTLAGEFKEIVPLPGAEVCTAYVRGDYLYAPHLNGFLSILDKDFKVISNPGGSKPRYTDKGQLRPMRKEGDTFLHPHSILVDDEDSVYVPQWNSNKTYPIKLERVKA